MECAGYPLLFEMQWVMTQNGAAHDENLWAHPRARGTILWMGGWEVVGPRARSRHAQQRGSFAMPLSPLMRRPRLAGDIGVRALDTRKWRPPGRRPLPRVRGDRVVVGERAQVEAPRPLRRLPTFE